MKQEKFNKPAKKKYPFYTAPVKIVGNGQVEVSSLDILKSQKFWGDMKKFSAVKISRKPKP